MGAVRALQKRVTRLERAGKPRPSWIVIHYGSFDAFAEWVFQEIIAGRLSEEFAEVVAALRVWETENVWNTAYVG